MIENYSIFSTELLDVVAEKISEISKNSKAVCFNYLRSFLVTGREPRFFQTLPIYLKLHGKVCQIIYSLRATHLNHLQLVLHKKNI